MNLSAYWIVVGVLVVAIVVFAGVLNSKGRISLGNTQIVMMSGSTLTTEEAQQVATDYINETVLENQVAAEISNFTEDDRGLYTFTVGIQGQEFDSYMTMDGSLIFPEALDLNESVDDTTEEITTEDGETIEADGEEATIEADGETIEEDSSDEETTESNN